MQISYAVLIDGGFVKHKLGSAKSPMTATVLSGFIEQIKSAPVLKDMRLHRVYYYDAQPSADVIAKPLGGGVLDFGKTDAFIRNKKLFADLIHIPFLALRMGEVAQNGWRISQKLLKTSAQTVNITSSDLLPAIGQKGVDMRIGLDIASLTLKKQVQIIVLVTGDSDFVPAMKFARKEGAQLILVTLGHGIRETMREHSDLVLDTLLEVGQTTPPPPT
jgi:uncharacterized LabA/DUF88 family protein